MKSLMLSSQRLNTWPNCSYNLPQKCSPDCPVWIFLVSVNEVVCHIPFSPSPTRRWTFCFVQLLSASLFLDGMLSSSWVLTQSQLELHIYQVEFLLLDRFIDSGIQSDLLMAFRDKNMCGTPQNLWVHCLSCHFSRVTAKFLLGLSPTFFAGSFQSNWCSGISCLKTLNSVLFPDSTVVASQSWLGPAQKPEWVWGWPASHLS